MAVADSHHHRPSALHEFQTMGYDGRIVREGFAVSESFLVDVPDDLPRFQLPDGVQARLQDLLDRQDAGQPLSDAERSEAEGLVNVAELLTWLRLRTERGKG